MTASPDIIVLFSGGLDSILAAKVLEDQGLQVRCLHCVSPFFGDAEALPRWRRLHGLDIVSLDVSTDFAALLRRRPAHGFGKVMNPCVDCKILLLRHARLYMETVGARLLAISGRGRGEQLALAAHFGLKEIPTPGGGCRLTERENARRYWPVLTRRDGDGDALARDFALANLGRQFWRRLDGRDYWLGVGRNNADNKRLAAAAGPEDALLSLTGLPGPLGLAREGAAWPRPLLEEAAALTASYAPKAVAAQGLTALRADWRDGGQDLAVPPQRAGTLWSEPSWEEVRAEIREEARLRRETQSRSDA